MSKNHCFVCHRVRGGESWLTRLSGIRQAKTAYNDQDYNEQDIWLRQGEKTVRSTVERNNDSGYC